MNHMSAADIMAMKHKEEIDALKAELTAVQLIADENYDAAQRHIGRIKELDSIVESLQCCLASWC